MDLPLSLLDRSRTRAGSSDAQALRNTVERARAAEEAGYSRFWVAEHHGVPGIASGAPPLLMQAVAQATRRIRVGSGGIMLPNHRPIVVAEQLAVLTALHGARFDLGVGRSLGFTRPVREALGALSARPEEFLADIRSLRDHLEGSAAVTIRPAGVPAPPIHVLGTGAGLLFAAELGLPAVVGGPALRGGPDPFERYRRDFHPSERFPEPPLIASADSLVADSQAEADQLALPEAWSMAEARSAGAFPPLVPPGRIPEEPAPRQRRTVEDTLEGTIAGTEDRVLTELTELLERTGADEVMSTASTFDLDALRASDRRLAAAVRSA